MSERIIGRQHRIHYSTGKGKILCGTKKWQCSDATWNGIECKFCLAKRDANVLLPEQEEKK